MSIHPAHAIPFNDLVAQLTAAVRDGHVSERRHPDRPDLALYCYTNRCVYENAWTPVIEAARGLVIDHGTQRVVATPFPKFFNHGERTAAMPDEPFEVFDKLDGSLGVVFFDDVTSTWRVATKGSFTSTQAQWATAHLDTLNTSSLTRGATYCFEIVYTANRIVVRYPWEGLALLAVYGDDGCEWTRRDVVAEANGLGSRVVTSYLYASLDAMVLAARTFAADREGFVVRFASGYRIKVKGDEYLRVHRLVSRVTPLALWESMAEGDDLDAIRREIPEEFYDDFDTIRAALTHRFVDVVSATEDAHAARCDVSDKDVGLALASIPQPARQFIFARRKHGPTWHALPKFRNDVCRVFRPTANVLAGYSPSAAMHRFADDA
jgi:RNA ligase